MCYFEISEVRERKTMLAVRLDVHKKLQFRWKGVAKFRVDGEIKLGNKTAAVANIYLPPEGSKNWGKDIIAGAEAWGNHFCGGDCTWRGDKGMMKSLAKGRATELGDMDCGEKVWKERLTVRDWRLWESWPKNCRTASPASGTPWTTRSSWGRGSRQRLDYLHGPVWADSNGWECIPADVAASADHDCMIVR